ncbi:MAG TPA: Ldh family oxidoreductase [Candidatus Thioglobus sp.]|jgi:(2R)-3-sulfolactate dehydrogenase (NADP+)|nr:Ldh family oxidoreductase [Candidatus Thioglobus sp.]HIK77761.1 Ldh family oxidoreductase [Gammaproteobacteria bacterium]
MKKTLKLNEKEAWDLAFNALTKSNTSDSNAKEVADALINAEFDGQSGHGLSRIPSYVEQLTSGKVAGNVSPSILGINGGVIRIDANHGFAFPAISLAISEITNACKKYGIAAASISRSHHFGQAGRHVERLAERGLIGLMFGNTPKAIPPWGGSKALFGTNPIAFSSPREDAAPLVVDLSLSKVARGKVMVANQQNEKIPLGWAIDGEGKPTTDPKKALAGAMLPIGDAKGSALALMVEILAAGLTGSNFGFEASSFLNAEGDSPGVGQLIIAIDPSFFSGEGFGGRTETIINAILEQPSTRLPGDKRLEKRKAREKSEKITISKELYEKIELLT